MDNLISDSTQVEISNKVKDRFRALFIDDCKSELHKQFQTTTECRYQIIKRSTNNFLDRIGAPSYCWLLAMGCIFFLLNYS